MASKTINLQVKLEFSDEVEDHSAVVQNVLDAIRHAVYEFGIAPDGEMAITERIEVRDPEEDISKGVYIGISLEADDKGEHL